MNVIKNMDYMIHRLPIVKMLYAPATYTWLLIIGVYIILTKKKYSKLQVYIPMGIILLINIASPVNGNLRYMLPVLVCTPIIFAYTISDY